MLALWRQRPRTDELPPEQPDEMAALRERLRALVARINAAADQLPVGVVPEARAVCDVVRELLDHEERTSHTSVAAAQRISLEATVDDYLPGSLEAYLALPASFTAQHRNATDHTPGEELLAQLVLLHEAVRDLAEAVYSGDARRLSDQGRFLNAKFARSELDLG